MASPRRFGRVQSSPKRASLWGAGPSSAAIQSLSASGALAVDTGQSFVGPSTLVRIRGMLTIWLESVGSIGDGFTQVVAGIGICSTDAFTTGLGAIPNPIGDIDWPWIWYQNVGAMVGQSVTESENTGELAQVRLPIDSKAMRKIKSNETVFGRIQVGAEVGVTILSFTMDTRMLLKLV